MGLNCQHLQPKALAQCGDSRDRIYGLLGLLQCILHEDISNLIAVDYTKPVQSLYHDVLALFLNRSRSLDCLSLQLPQFRTDDYQISWTIDLRDDMPSNGLEIIVGQSACRGLEELRRANTSQVHPFKVHDLSITVFGGCLDIITDIVVFSGLSSTLRIAQELACLLPDQISGRRRFETLWRSTLR